MTNDKLREILQEIYERRGQLTPGIVVQEATPEHHPLHPEFTWNDAEAAAAHRRNQAHQLIRTARIRYKEADEHTEERSVRAFHALSTPRGWVYEPTDAVIEDPFKRKMVLNTMQREWMTLKRRYERFDEFLTMIRGDVNGEDIA